MYEGVRRRNASFGVEERPEAVRLLLLMLFCGRNATAISKVKVDCSRESEVGGYDSEIFFCTVNGIGLLVDMQNRDYYLVTNQPQFKSAIRLPSGHR